MCLRNLNIFDSDVHANCERVTVDNNMYRKELKILWITIICR